MPWLIRKRIRTTIRATMAKEFAESNECKMKLLDKQKIIISIFCQFSWSCVNVYNKIKMSQEPFKIIQSKWWKCLPNHFAKHTFSHSEMWRLYLIKMGWRNASNMLNYIFERYPMHTKLLPETNSLRIHISNIIQLTEDNPNRLLFRIFVFCFLFIPIALSPPTNRDQRNQVIFHLCPSDKFVRNNISGFLFKNNPEQR